MVHVIDGVVKPGGFPRVSDSYQRRPTAFQIKDYPKVAEAIQPGRYHLIVCTACPWAHRALLVRQLKGLDKDISLSIVSPFRDDDVGWSFFDPSEKVYPNMMTPTKDNATGQNFKLLNQVYLLADPKYTGNITTPVLFDSVEKKIVSNESWDIARYLDRAFLPGSHAPVQYSLYPEELAVEIDEFAMYVQNNLNNAVYQCGMARSQDAYEVSLGNIFKCLDKLEDVLSRNRYLIKQDKNLTVADIQLFTTLIRFDDVYHVLFKCWDRRISSYYNVSNYLKELYQIPVVRATVDAQHYKDHYYTSFTSCNPSKVVPLGSVVPSLDAPHDRAKKFQANVVDSNAAIHDAQGDEKKAKKAKGEFVRGVSAHRTQITQKGEGENELPAERGRYHLVIANNCPWCHRVMLARAMLGLEDVISADVLFYRRDPEKGWQFLPDDESQLRAIEIKNRATLLDGKVAKSDSVTGLKYAPEIYKLSGSTERSVPLLFDKKTNKVVNNESAEIVRMFALGFVDFHKKGAPELYPSHLSQQIDEINSWIYPEINNGAYKAGFSSSQESYEAAYKTYFAAFDRLEKIFSERKFLTGERPTEADLRLFPTMARHDPVYYNRMKLNEKMVRDSPHLNRWLQDMYALHGVKAATDMEHCIYGYFGRTGNNLIPHNNQETPDGQPGFNFW
eukprot:CAMPEP_0203754926 /NCGR_PEP_ID=MMETSP0098-20131031/8467_1 /ASSEMBLY_ACC=CAM_ASM_000208 /TAXON_ID=96639 /ORGANISM=" , Strain NY0313808BC1" /LENGTH=672 /DNA_ID=CAMNT_0050646181 /DNA_START=83 /DNA_END=2098 /DNA_ORIENTATION=-